MHSDVPAARSGGVRGAESAKPHRIFPACLPTSHAMSFQPSLHPRVESATRSGQDLKVSVRDPVHARVDGRWGQLRLTCNVSTPPTPLRSKPQLLYTFSAFGAMASVMPASFEKPVLSKIYHHGNQPPSTLAISKKHPAKAVSQKGDGYSLQLCVLLSSAQLLPRALQYLHRLRQPGADNLFPSYLA